VLSPYVPSFRYLLDDLSRRSDEELRARAMGALGLVTLVLLRSSRSGREALERLLEYRDSLRAIWQAPDGEQALRAIFRYVAVAREAVTLQDLSGQLVMVLGEEAQEVVMTEGQMMIDRWRAEGEAKGRAEGEARGRAEGETKGRAEGRAEALLGLLAARGLEVSEQLRARIRSCTDIATLDRWIARGATARSAAEAVSEG
jgi:hypothetical protein